MNAYEFFHAHFAAICAIYTMTIVALVGRSLIAIQFDVRLSPVEVKSLNLQLAPFEVKAVVGADMAVELNENVRVLVEGEGGGGGGGPRAPTLEDLERGEAPPAEESDGQVVDARVNVVGPPGKA